ncbi:tryptophan halogenase family protein [Kordiimonas lacus]|uniref:Tryptophan halogenase n=1 Tax=Kordiimonas lacus TaxID=637679 RepID=A0A1G6ZI51_9PROT|nr:tryptophan halogenase family protein [Kordiimonas lacus]SDE02404.1 tryptophan halogenase [Kordiimonas lacus]
MAAGGGHDTLIKHVLVVGGGTAGWLAACHLAKALRSADATGVRVTLVESADIPTIGVGEGTVPAIRKSLQHLGIDEADFIRECDATFKQSIKFVDWLHAPNGTSHAYHHVFDYPANNGLDLTPYWLMGGAGNASFVDAVSVQGQVCDAGLGPKVMTNRQYEGLTSYAYHLDAAKLAAFLTGHATSKLGVEHKLANVTDVVLAEDGSIKAVTTDAFGDLEADLFVDCTGFSSLLLGQKMGVGFIDKRDTLFVDHAVAAQVPYTSADAPIPCHTISTAREAGWIWDIGLTERRGTGYVYAADYTDHDRAEAVLRDYLRESIGDAADEVATRRIPMRIGYREKFWEKNCVAIGMSQGFVEPLEATGLLVFDATARMLADQFPPTQAAMPLLAKRFNDRVRNAWDRVIDFIKLHYCLSKRDDTAFWRDNRDEAKLPEGLRENLALWRTQPPTVYDFPNKFDVFGIENYLYVLYGMGFETDMAPLEHRYTDTVLAREDFGYVRQMADQMTGQLLPHRTLIDRIKQYGIQKV